MKLFRRTVLVLGSLVVVGLLVCSAYWWLRPPKTTFQAEVAKEATTVALQLVGLSAVVGIASWLMRDARETREFAARVRKAYSKAKARRRRLRRLTPQKRRGELGHLDEIQLEFEDLREEARWRYGEKCPVLKKLRVLERYLHDLASKKVPLGDFTAKYPHGPGFVEFKAAYHAIRAHFQPKTRVLWLASIQERLQRISRVTASRSQANTGA